MRWLRHAWHGVTNRSVPRASWSVYHPNSRHPPLHAPTKLLMRRSGRVNLSQADLHPSVLQRNLIRFGATLVVSSAAYQFFTNLHTVPITGRTQVVVLTNEEECELGTKAANDEIGSATVVTSGERYRMCLDVSARLVSVSEHLFPREYDWRITLVDAPWNPNAVCYPGGKIVVYSGILDMIDYAVDKGICKSKHDALAVILSHEIGHALARHTAECLSYLPLLYVQPIIDLENPLVQYLFEYVFNLPFSRKQETEADHIGLMLMASACYHPAEAPKLWKAFERYVTMLQNDGVDTEDDTSSLTIDFDFFSTHPSNAKREAALTHLVNDAIARQAQCSWCLSLREKVEQLVTASATESEFLNRINVFRTQQRVVARRNTVGTIHELENEQVFQILRDEKAKRLQQVVEEAEKTAVDVTPVDDEGDTGWRAK